MSVPKGMRGESRLDVQVKVEDLVTHTIRIMSNERVFDPRYRDFGGRVIDCAVGIGQDMWEANGIRVNNDPRRWEARRALQERACRRLDTLLYLIGVCQRLYHLRRGKAEAWVRKAYEARDLARKWRDSDVRRYRHLGLGGGL